MSTSPVKAVAAYCHERCKHAAAAEGLHGHTWWSRGYAVASCDREDCPLHPYRLGRNPARAGVGGRPKRA